MKLRTFARRSLILVMLAAIGLALYEWAQRHPGHLPWTPLSLAEPIARFTPMKIDRLHEDFPACRAILDAASERYSALPPVQGRNECGYDNAVLLQNAGGVHYAPAAGVSCPLATGLFLWEKQVVEPAALQHFGQAVETIETYGTYSCRRVGGGQEGRLSEHASANAIDIAAFRLADGRRIGVAGDWSGGGPKAAFLRDVRDGACRVFATTLSPDYNPAHQDHLHLDQARRGGWTFCR
jgi:hypothetical protein